MGRLLQPALAILTVCGCWKPSSSSSSWKNMMYSFHTIFILLVLHSFALSQFLNLVLNVKTANELSDSLYLCIASLTACGKLLTLLINRSNIKTLTEELTREPTKPRDMDEVNIQQKFDKIIGSTTIQYLVMVESTVVCMILTSLLTDFRKKDLAYRAWLPYDYSPTNIYYLTYLHQILGLIITSLLNVACDCIIFGLLAHTNAQLETLEHRLKKITPETKNDVEKCVQYHIYIYRYARTINEKFQIIIGIQFLSSTLIMCFNLYELANLGPLSLKYLEIITYMICMCLQIFYYCWYGNQLKLQLRHSMTTTYVVRLVFRYSKYIRPTLSFSRSWLHLMWNIDERQHHSIEFIYMPFKIDWTILDSSTKKSLLMIMKRATNPIEFTSLFVISMDLQTFGSILKLSYSSYNLLQRTGSS